MQRSRKIHPLRERETNKQKKTEYIEIDPEHRGKDTFK